MNSENVYTSLIEEPDGTITTVLTEGPSEDDDLEFDEEEFEAEEAEDDDSGIEFLDLLKREELKREYNYMTTSSLGGPFSINGSYYGPPSSGTTTAYRGYTPGTYSNNNSSPWWQTPGTTAVSNSTQSVNNQYVAQPAQTRNDINYRTKKLLFCSIFDTIICSKFSWQQQGVSKIFIPNVAINSIFDVDYRFDVLSKIRKFTPDIIYLIVPRQFLIRLSNNCCMNIKTAEEIGHYSRVIEDIIRLKVATYLGLSDIKKCQLIIFDDIDYRNVSANITGVINSLNNLTNNNYASEVIGYIGAASGNNGYNSDDFLVAQSANIEYFDTNILLVN